MIETRNIHSLTDFLRRHRAHITRLKQTRKPEVLTVKGRAELVVMDAEAFQKMVEQWEFEETVTMIQQGLDAIDQGESQPAEKAMSELHARYGLPEVRPQE